MTVEKTVWYGDFWVHDGPWTEEDYLALPSDGPKLELIDGNLLVSPAPRKAHQQMMRRLANLMEATAPADLEVSEELNVRVGAEKILIPDVVATYEQGGDVLMHAPEHVLLVAEVRSPSNTGREWAYKTHLYAQAGIPWYLLVEVDEAGRPLLMLRRLDDGKYVEVAHAGCGETLKLPDPLGRIDPADLLRRRPRP